MSGAEQLRGIATRTVRVGAAVASVLVALAWRYDPVGAAPRQADPAPTLQVDPTTFKAGRVLALAGQHCVLDGQPMEEAFFSLGLQSMTVPFGASATFPVGADGSWSGHIVVPTDAPAGMYSLRVLCLEDDVAVGGPQDQFGTLIDEPPASVVLDAPVAAAGAVFSIRVLGCTFEDGSSASSALLTVDSVTGTVATTEVNVTQGAGNAAVALPGSLVPGTVLSVRATCSGDLGALVAVPVGLTVEAAPAAPAIVRTG